MRYLISSVFCLASLVFLFSACSTSGVHNVPMGSKAAKEDVELVQSVPESTDLAYPGTRGTLDVWTKMIGASKKTIDLSHFYVSSAKGEGLEKVILSLSEAGSRGVKIRMVVDAKMAGAYPGSLDQLKAISGFKLRVIDLKKITGGIMHAKYFIVDDKEAFLGSANFDWRALSQIHELGVRLSDKKAVASLASIFAIDWKIAGGEKVEAGCGCAMKKQGSMLESLADLANQDGTLLITASPKSINPKGMPGSEAAIVALIDGALKAVDIQVMEYYPTDYKRTKYYPTLENAIRSAAMRGVKVRMIVSDWNLGEPDRYFLKSLHLVPNVEIKISSIPDLKKRFIPYARVEHCKYMVVDGKRGWMGTSNWSEDYFTASRNVDMVVNLSHIVGQLGGIFEKSWNGKYTKTLDVSKNYSKRKRH